MRQLMQLMENIEQGKIRIDKFIYKEDDLDFTVDEVSSNIPTASDKILNMPFKNPKTGNTIKLKSGIENWDYNVSSAAQRIYDKEMAKYKQQLSSKMKSKKHAELISTPIDKIRNRVKATDSIMMQSHSKLQRELSKGLKAVFEEYTNDLYGEVNQSLRKKRNPMLPQTRDVGMRQASDYIRALDAVFKSPSAKLPMDMVVYRGVESRIVKKMVRGRVFKDHGFVSTTINPNTAEQFGDDNIVLKIALPKGMPAVYANVVGSKNRQEKEIVLPRGLKFKVLGTYIERSRSSDMTIVALEPILK